MNNTISVGKCNRYTIFNALTIDVEDYYMVSAFSDIVTFDNWRKYESRIERNTYKIIEILDLYNTKATFFVLGWVAEHYPGLIKDIYNEGHEIACHGYNHRLAYHLSPEEFREDTKRAKAIIEDAIGDRIEGYRATSWSITKETLYALDILIEEGFYYDSSIFPVHHDIYGMPGFSRFPVIIKRKSTGEIIEVPPSTISIFNYNLPISGGGYLRLFPYRFIKLGIEYINHTESKPAIIYVHPWEIDPDQPRLEGKALSKFRHYSCLRSTYKKLKNLLTHFHFRPLKEILSHVELRPYEL